MATGTTSNPITAFATRWACSRDGGKLWAFMGGFYANEQPYHRVHTRAYLLNESSGQWKPGESLFSKVFLIRPSVFEGTPGVSDPKADFSYPYAVEHQGKLYIGYTHKSHAANELAVVPIESLDFQP